MQNTRIESNQLNNSEFNNNIKTFLLNPLKSGMGGFAAFFVLLLLTKTLGYLFGIQPEFDFSFTDVVFSLTGFVLAAGAKFMAFFSNE
jgi:hypothetical protein